MKEQWPKIEIEAQILKRGGIWLMATIVLGLFNYVLALLSETLCWGTHVG